MSEVGKEGLAELCGVAWRMNIAILSRNRSVSSTQRLVESAIDRGQEVRVIDYLKGPLNIAGMDLLRSDHGPVILEVNSSPGLEGIEGAAGKDVVGTIVKFMGKHAKAGKTRTRGKG
jgi:glutathione synthase/RimK-type ligase-like ATP-grasp enzyme